MTSELDTRAKEMSLDQLGRYGLVLARLTIGYLWITQLAWKMPPTFGCPPDFAVSTSFNSRTTGLCDWAGLMAVYSKVPAHAAFVKGFIIPNISWVGWGVWLVEAFIAASLVLGLLTRLGAFAGLVQAVNLYIGLTAIPYEWYWTYGMLITLQLIFFCVPPGRTLGIDAWLRSHRTSADGMSSRLSRLIFGLT
jgi:uncharacterized membrane protein YphA (DoxX/SURF4 family)